MAALLGVEPGDLVAGDDLAEAGLDEVVAARLAAELAAELGVPGLELPRPPGDPRALADHLIRTWPQAAVRVVSPAGDGPAAAEVPGPAQVPELADIAFTLQLGREALPERLAVVGDRPAGLAAALRAYAATGQPPAVAGVPVLTGTVLPIAQGGGAAAVPEADGDGPALRSARRWVAGLDPGWRQLHPAPRRRVALPGYPFAARRHWLPAGPTIDEGNGVNPTGSPPQAAPQEGTAEPDPRLRERVLEVLVSTAAQVIGLPVGELDPRLPVGDFGFESVALQSVAAQAADDLGVPLLPTIFYERASIDGVVDHLLEEHGTRLAQRFTAAADPPGPAAAEPPARNGRGPVAPASGEAPPRPSVLPADRAAGGGDPAEPIAVIGISGRFPGSPDLESYWANLRDRRDLISEVPADRWDWRALDTALVPPGQRPALRWGGFVDDVDLFEPLLFGLTAAEADMMDPQQRLLLELVRDALEDAGRRPAELAGSDTGLFVGLQFADYQHLLHEAGVLNVQTVLGNEHAVAVNRISYLMDLHGPSEPVNTACSSSLVAVHRAVRALRSGDSSLALAGGIGLNLAPHSTMAVAMMGVLSPGGRCLTLDRNADGYVKGEGMGIVVLKRLGDAVADGDRVHAVIRGTAVNHGGRAASLTAPNSQAQAALLVAAVRDAGIDPGQLGYLELHGTATPLGDPVEVSGIRAAFRQLARQEGVRVPAPGACGIGSVKTNIGHLEPASGMAGLLKMILALRHRTLPGIVHLQDPNPYLDLEGSQLRIVAGTEPWAAPSDAAGVVRPRLAGINAFGFGGVNAHVIVEEPPAPVADAGANRPGERVIVLSARTPDSLTANAKALADRLRHWQQAPGERPSLDAVALTLAAGREPLAERLAVVAADHDALLGALDAVLAGQADRAGVLRGRAAGRARPPEPDAGAEAWARFWTSGGDLPVEQAVPGGRRPGLQPTSLPTYRYDRKRHWFSRDVSGTGAAPAPAVAPAALPVGALAGADPGPGADPAAGGAAVGASVRRILAAALRVTEGEIDDASTFRDLGVDSLLSISVMQGLQQAFGESLPFSLLADHPTPGELATFLVAWLPAEQLAPVAAPSPSTGAAPAAPAPTAAAPAAAAVTAAAPAAAAPEVRRSRPSLPPELLPLNARGSAQASFWVPGAAGFGASVQNLSRALGPDYPFYAFQTRGSDGVSMPQTLAEMVDHYAACVRLVQPHGPYVIGGYSFGGLIAMDLARRLREQGEEIRGLVMFDTYPAEQTVFDLHREKYDVDFMQFYMTNYFLDLRANPEAAIRPSDVAHLPESLRLAELARLAKERGGKRIATDDIYRFLRGGLTCAAQSEGLYQTYRMRPYDASDVLFFEALDGFTGRASEIYWRPTRIMEGYDYVTPWRGLVERDFELVQLDNDHLNMLEDPTLSVAVRHVQRILHRELPAERAAREEPSSAGALSGYGGILLAHRLAAASGVTTAGQLLDPDRLLALAEAGEPARPVVQAQLQLLERHGLLDATADGLATTAAWAAAATVDRAALRAGLEAARPDLRAAVPLVTACQERWPDLVGGRVRAADVLTAAAGGEAPDGEGAGGSAVGSPADVLAALDPMVAAVHQDVVRTMATQLRGVTRRFPLTVAQVLQVGSDGSVTLARQGLAALAGERLRWRWLLTERTRAELARVQSALAGQAAATEPAVLDLDRSAAEQGFEPHSIDVVVAVTALRRVRSVPAALACLREVLKPGGLLVLAEREAGDLELLTTASDPAERFTARDQDAGRRWAAELCAAGFGVVASRDGGADDGAGPCWTTLLAEPRASGAAGCGDPLPVPGAISPNGLDPVTVGGVG